MTQMIDQASPQTATDTDMVGAVQEVLRQNDEPLTVSKIRSALPAALRSVTPEELGEVLRRQVAANVLYQYPKYRSQQDRYWDRPMRTHVACLLKEAMADMALGLSELHRKLPAYAHSHTEEVLQEELNQGKLHRHPKVGRGGERFGVRPPEAGEYLRTELIDLFGRLEKLGFTQEQLRVGALELLHDEEWAAPPPAPAQESPQQQPPAGDTGSPQQSPQM